MTQTILVEAQEKSLKQLAIVAYVLLGISLFTALPTGLVGLIIAHLKRGEARDTWLASHFDFVIQTFWLSVVGFIIAGVLFCTIIGIPLAILLCAAVWLWTLYRVVKGALALNDNQEVAI
ncbi:hypothetical protein FNU76_06675 [Chitinimonas arctica]|uniref:DUF4870 domain-containing protein n=1 Tax=Chitinimonas arctica TaxID=2594795 RepID=A0A516SD32_9NEIS|nr:hypothetical protein [Chitinimonas arctica]QDQ26057.1 hypothetical protein FNU76_06675 [Chitinimonas arctica]